MVEFSHLILCNGRYQLLALSPNLDYASEDIVGYAVATSSGERLREETTLALAHAWMDQCIEDDAIAHAVLASPHARAGPIRR